MIVKNMIHEKYIKVWCLEIINNRLLLLRQQQQLQLNPSYIFFLKRNMEIDVLSIFITNLARNNKGANTVMLFSMYLKCGIIS